MVQKHGGEAVRAISYARAWKEDELLVELPNAQPPEQHRALACLLCDSHTVPLLHQPVEVLLLRGQKDRRRTFVKQMPRLPGDVLWTRDPHRAAFQPQQLRGQAQHRLVKAALLPMCTPPGVISSCFEFLPIQPAAI